MKWFSVALALSASMTMPQVASAQDLLGTLNKILGGTNKTVSAVGSVGGSDFMVAQTEAQAQQTREAIEFNYDTPEAGVSFAEASDLIFELTRTSACGVNNMAFNRLNRRQERPTSWSTFKGSVARYRSQYHDAGQCYDVMKIMDVKMPAPNALQFVAYYISPSSHEAAHQAFTLIKSARGDWLIREIGYASS